MGFPANERGKIRVDRVRRARVIRRKFFRLAAALVVTIAVALGFGVPSSDLARIDNFADAVQRWQVNPDFPRVQREYVQLGSTRLSLSVRITDWWRFNRWILRRVIRL